MQQMIRLLTIIAASRDASGGNAPRNLRGDANATATQSAKNTSTGVQVGANIAELEELDVKLAATEGEESEKSPDVAVLSEMNASERAAFMSEMSSREQSKSGSDISMIWPGSGYAGVMNGGIWQAAKFDHGYTIDSILASSGGASSAFLCFIDEAHGSDRSLTRYKQLYTKYASASVFGWSSTTRGCNTKPADDDACWWYYNYKQALDAQSFQNVKKKLKISLKCENKGLVVLYNFKSQDQVAQALAAAGNAGASSFKVDSLNDWCWDHDTSAEGYGFPREFNPRRLPIWYYNNGPLTSASGEWCSDGFTPILAAGYSCPDDAVRLARTKHWRNTDYLWRPGTYVSISNNFNYATGVANWLDGECSCDRTR